jgi:thymidylate synthase
MPTRELRWDQIEVSNPLTFPMQVNGREMKDVIGVLEATSLVGQFSVPELFTSRVRKFGDFMDAGVFHGSYGSRVYGRLGDLVDLLARDPDTRQAVLTIFESRQDLGAAKKDIPCTISIQFLRRGGKLEMKVMMRSNDLWLGMPYDFVQFAVLQASIAQALGIEVGTYVHSTGSLHLYDRDAKKAEVVSFKGGPEMPFPLWYNVDPMAGPVDRMADIAQRARMLALGRIQPSTEFERWAQSLLDG